MGNPDDSLELEYLIGREELDEALDQEVQELLQLCEARRLRSKRALETLREVVKLRADCSKIEDAAYDTAAYVRELEALCGRASVVMGWLMRGIGSISIPDYGELNNVS